MYRHRCMVAREFKNRKQVISNITQKIMANKREFKKFVEAVGASVCDEMMVAYYNVEGADRNAIAKAIEKVLLSINSARCNADVFFDRGPRSFGGDMKAYRKASQTFYKSLFKKITSDFSTSIDEALKEFNAALPAAEKEKNKVAAEA